MFCLDDGHETTRSFVFGKRPFLNGCFDLLHLGHLSLITSANRELKERLVVAINSDASVKRLKGSTRPIQDELTRASILAAFPEVGDVVVFDEDTPLQLIELIRPQCIVKGGQYEGQAIVGTDFASARFFPMVEGFSTTKLVERCRRES